MLTHYSILSAQIRPEIQEKISVGFLMIGEQGEVIFEYSPNKLGIAKKLLTPNSYLQLKDSLNNISSMYNKELRKNDMQSQNAIGFKTENKSTLNIDYISYLNKYSNNVLNFSTPKKIDLEFSPINFSKLFSKFIDEKYALRDELSPGMSYSLIDKLSLKYSAQLHNHFNVDKKINIEEMPSLLMPVKIDLIGVNEIPVFAHEVDFNRTFSLVKREFSELVMLRMAFLDQGKQPKGFVICNEPDKSESKHHEIWNHIRKNSDFEYVDCSEAELVMEYAVEHEVKPLFKESDIF